MAEQINVYYSGNLCDVNKFDEEHILTSKLFDILPIERKEKVSRIVPIKGKRESIGAFVLLMHGLANEGIIKDIYDVTGFERLGLTKTEKGKPFFDNFPEICFSLSHTDDMAACALAHYDIGLDIQCHNKSNYRNIYSRFFSEEEISFLDGIIEEDERKKLFFDLWSYKESFVKMTGEGLSCSLDSFTIELNKIPVQIGKISDNDLYYKFGGTKFYPLNLEENISASVCINESDDVQIMAHKVDINKLTARND